MNSKVVCLHPGVVLRASDGTVRIEGWHFEGGEPAKGLPGLLSQICDWLEENERPYEAEIARSALADLSATQTQKSPERKPGP